jgi:hypothetical protein
MNIFYWKDCIKVAVCFFILSIFYGCKTNHYSIKTEYREPITDKDSRTIESTVEGYSTARDISKMYMTVFDFVNKQLMRK